jgi:hypothetical protein
VKKENDMEKFTESENELIKEAIENNITTLGCVEFMLRIKPYKGRYLWMSSLLMLGLIFFYGLPLIAFFLPLVPILVINIIYFIDMNVVVWSITKAQNFLIKHDIKIDWESMMEYTYQYYQQLINRNNDEEEK